MNTQINAMITRAVLNWRSSLLGIVLCSMQMLDAAQRSHGQDKVGVALAVLTALSGFLVKD